MQNDIKAATTLLKSFCKCCLCLSAQVLCVAVLVCTPLVLWLCVRIVYMFCFLHNMLFTNRGQVFQLAMCQTCVMISNNHLQFIDSLFCCPALDVWMVGGLDASICIRSHCMPLIYNCFPIYFLSGFVAFRLCLRMFYSFCIFPQIALAIGVLTVLVKGPWTLPQSVRATPEHFLW